MICSDGLWDTSRIWYQPNPQFTDCFINIILTWVPCLLYLAVSIIWFLLSLPKNTNIFVFNKLHVFKKVLTSLLSLISIGHLACAVKFRSETSVEELTSPVIFMVAIVWATFCTFYEEKRRLPCTSHLTLFWLLITLAQLLVIASRGQQNISAMTFFPKLTFIFVVIKFSFLVVLLLIALRVDRLPIKLTGNDNSFPDLKVSYLNSIICLWFLKYVDIARKKMLSAEDLWDRNYKVNSTVLNNDMENTIMKIKICGDKSDKREFQRLSELQILRVLIGSDYKILLNALVLNLGANLLNIAQPILLGYVINFITIKSMLQWKGYLFTLGLTLVSLMSGMMRAYSVKLSMSCSATIRSRIMLLVFHKSFKLSAKARDELPEALALTLIGSDAEIFYETFTMITNLFNLPIIVTIILYIIYTDVGNPMFVGVAILVLSFILTGIASAYQKKSQTLNFRLKDERTNILFQFFNGIKFFKLYGWEYPIKKLVNSIRIKELVYLMWSFFLASFAIVVMITGPNWIILATIGLFIETIKPGMFNPGVIFETISLLNMLRSITILLPLIIFNIVSARVALKRIAKFYNSDEITQERGTISKVLEKDDRIILEDASFSWESDIPTLKNISLSIKKNSLTVVIGRVGSGKSSLLSALLDEMNLLSGGFYIGDSIALCQQHAWLRNATLRDNITMFNDYDEAWFNKVVELCCLRADIDMMADGELTEIGEKGLNLSGGQKQRISLARAVYSKAEIYLMDDVLSAVDAHVGKKLFDNVIGPKGCLRNKTVLLMTNTISYLSQADFIVSLRAGEITFKGDYEALTKMPNFQEFISNIDMESVNSEEAVSLYSEPVRERTKSFLSEREVTIDIISMEVDIPHKLIQDEDAEIKKISSDVLKFYMKHFGIWNICGYMFFFSISLGTLVGLYSWLSYWMDTLIVNRGPKDTPYYLGIFGLFTALFAISIFLRSFVMFRAAIRASTRIHNMLFDNLMRSPLSFFEKTPIGRIMNRFITDILRIDITLPQQISAIGGTFVALCATFIYIIKANYIAAIPIVFVIIFTYFITKYYTNTARQSMSLELTTKSKLVTGYMEVVTGATTIKVSRLEDKFVDEYNKNMNKFLIMSFLRVMTTNWLTTSVQWISSSLILISALSGVVDRNNAISSEIGVSLNFSISIIAVFMFFLKTLGDIQTGFVSVKRVSEYAYVESEALWSIPEVDDTLNKSWPSEGVVEFMDYSARYREDLDCCLKNITCRIDPNQKIAVIGRTGAGKSSLTLALLRSLEAASGSIHIDGVDISTLGLHKLRHSVAIVPQDSYLITGTLRYNLDPFNYYSDKDIWEIVDPLEFRSHIPIGDMGLDFECTEGGNNLSAGSKQLVALARALLRKPKILILDEATASIDVTTDRLIQKTIREQFKNCTIITIAHRINTILDYDKAMVFESGRLVEYDHIPKLLDDPSSLFYGFANTVKKLDI